MEVSMITTKLATKNNKINYLTSVLNSKKGVSSLPTPVLMPSPKFCQKQQVSFIGGSGIIKGCRMDSGTWTYAVEMPLGVEPSMGRIGLETTIFLQEEDIKT
jgi:hypothetical protein